MSNKTAPFEERFWAKVAKSEGCWEWKRGRARNGYGRVWLPAPIKKQVSAHRAAFEMANGPIGPGMHIDHICRNRACVRPDHLRAVTPKQNHENRPIESTNSATGYRGVNYLKEIGRYRGYSRHHGKLYATKTFPMLEEAAEAVKALRLTLHTHNTLDRLEASK